MLVAAIPFTGRPPVLAPRRFAELGRVRADVIASFMVNPYASYLGEQNPFVVIASTPHRLSEMAAGPGKEPPAGKWDVRQILCHLADCEIAFAFRLRQAVAEDHHTIQPFDQDRWASMYRTFDAQDALDAFCSLRQWNLAFIAGQPEAVYSKQLTHPERGTMTFRTLVETMAGHDLNHLGQVAALVE